jgi:hypothetical protein
MKAIIHTSDDYFQHYIPLFAYCFHRLYPSVEIHATIYGSADPLTRTAAEGLSYLKIHEDNRTVPPAMGRFLNLPAGELLIADADILFMAPGLIEYCQRMAKQLNTCYYAAHGARKKPHRFPDSWKGEKERLCGAFVYITDEWLKKTKVFREMTLHALNNGMLQEYREEDEVVLCNLCKHACLPINQDKFFPLQHRGVHLGDFKPEMKHRYTDIAQMAGKLHRDALNEYMAMEREDSQWIKLVRFICDNDPKIREVFKNLYDYIARKR